MPLRTITLTEGIIIGRHICRCIKFCLYLNKGIDILLKNLNQIRIKMLSALIMDNITGYFNGVGGFMRALGGKSVKTVD